MTEKNLSLYQYDGCPFCIRVMTTIKRLNVDVEIRNIRKNPKHLSDLRDARGRTTVPVLRIEGGGQDHWMPESGDIVKWLKKSYG